MEPEWRNTQQFSRIDYVRIEVPTSKTIIVRSEWPPSMHWLFDLFIVTPSAQDNRAFATPRFIAASRASNRILHQAWGSTGWRDHFKPWLDKRVGP